MYKRDLAVVLLSFFALFLCLQHEGNFSFRKAWYHVTLSDPEKLEVLQDKLEDLPLPIVADLNGDGHLEVIIATHDYKLQLVRPEPPGRAGEGFAPVEVVKSFSLLPQKVMLGRDRRPVAMAVGFIDPEPREKVRPPRKQVLVVITASWQVLTFDHNLNLMWEVTVEDSLPPNSRLAEVSVLITPHQVHNGNRGLVIVGGSLELGDVAGAATGEAALGDLLQAAQPGSKATEAGGGGEGQLLENVLREELRFEAEELARAHGGVGLTGRGQPDPKQGGVRAPSHAVHAPDGSFVGDAPGALGGVDVSRHFSYYAYEGGRGEALWRHASGAFQKDLENSVDELRPQDDYRMRADSLAGRHFGELSCREFRESLLAVLPQSWNGLSDSKLEEALFVRHKEGAGEQKHQLARLAAAKAASGGRASHSSLHPRKQRASAFSLAHILGPSASASKAAAAKARAASSGHGLVVSKAAAAAAAASGGHTGMAHRHTHLALNSSTNALVAHVQDGVEVVHLYSGRTLCKLHLPPNQLHADINGDGVVDHVSVGSAGSGAAGPLGTSGLASHAALGPCMAAATSGIPPQHLLWRTHVCAPHHNLAAFEAGSRAEAEEASNVHFAPPIFLPVPRSDGSYSHLRGQHGLVVLMSDDGAVLALNGRGDKLWHRFFEVSWDASGADGAPTTPTLVPLALRPYSIPAAVLAVGSDAGVVISEHGNELASFQVAFPPAAPAVVADFDGDGLNDVIIVTRGGVFGYSQVQHLGGLSFGALLLTLIVAMGIVWYSQQYDASGALLAAAAAGVPGMLPGGGLGLSGLAVPAGGSAARARKLRSTEFVD